MIRFAESFLDLPIEESKIRILEESTLYAPYGFNPPQPWYVVVVKTPEKVRELVRLHKIKSPVIFLFFVNRGLSAIHTMTNVASGCTQAVNLAFQASALELGCFIDIDPPKDFVNRAFEIAKIPEKDYILSAVGFVGYPAQKKREVFFDVKERG